MQVTPGTGKNLQFVASMTISPSEIRIIRDLLHQSKCTVNPIDNVLITPLFSGPGALAEIRKLSECGTKVVFDSGGYYVQIGRLRYEQLYIPLLKSYINNQWASIYTLPDHVSTNHDDADQVNRKVSDTIIYSSLFYHELPDNLKARAMPVIQGHTLHHIDACLNAYLKLGVKHLGFGGFSTGGKNNEINIASNAAIDLVRYISRVAHMHDIKVHVFGLGRPALGAMIAGMNVDSFDSSSWLKAAGYGQVFLPFMRGYNITYRSTVSKINLGITFDQFQEWVNLTGHRCSLCNSIEQLQQFRMHRAVHNLICVSETVEMLNTGQYKLIEKIYQNGSPKYRNEIAKWLNN